MKKQMILAVCVLILMSGCSQQKSVEPVNTVVIKPTPAATATPDPNKIINIPYLTTQSPNDFQGLMPGSAISIRVSSDLDYYPSEDREYNLPNTPGGKLTVLFYKEKPVKFFMELPMSKQTKTPEELVKLAGIDVGKGKQISPLLTVWEGTFNNVNFKEIKARKKENTDYLYLSADIK